MIRLYVFELLVGIAFALSNSSCSDYIVNITECDCDSCECSECIKVINISQEKWDSIKLSTNKTN